MNKFDEALRESNEAYWNHGLDAAQAVLLDFVAGKDAELAAVRAIHEEDEALIGDLEKALKDLVAMHICDNCFWPGTACPGGDCRRIAEAANAVLLKVANRNKPQGGQDGYSLATEK